MSSPDYIVKFRNGASGVRRTSFDSAIDAAVENRPARVYRIASPNVLVAVVHVDGAVDLTPESADDRRR